MKALLRPLSWVYGWLSYGHRKLYERGVLQAVGVGKPVLSVGNLTFGGTGKTPFVLHLIDDLQKRSLRPAVVAKSYKASSKIAQEITLESAKDPLHFGDEACMYKTKNPSVKVFSGPSKVKAAMVAALEKKVDLVLVDDGFQHHKLHKDWNAVILDSTRPQDWHYFPEGRLREGFDTLKKADVIILSRTELVDQKSIHEIKRYLPEGKPVFTMQTKFKRLRTFDGHQVGHKILQVGLVCALGNPEQFKNFFKKHYPEVLVHTFFYRDHHSYDSKEVGFLEAEMLRLKLDFLVTTEKDESKIRKYAAWPHNWAVMDIEMEINESETWKKYWDSVVNELVGKSS